MKYNSVIPIELARIHEEDEESEDSSDSDDDLFQRVFVCRKCDKKFDLRHKLQVHLDREHPKIQGQESGVKKLKLDGERQCREDFDNGSVTGGGDAGARRRKLSNLSSMSTSVKNNVKTIDDNSVSTPTPKLKVDDPPHGKKLRVVLERLQFFHIEVETPSQGMREISYKVESESSPPKSGSEDSQRSGSSGSSVKYFDYRQVAVNALAKRVTPPEPPSVPKRDSSGIRLPPPVPPSVPKQTSCDKEDKSLDLKLPIEFSIAFNVNGLKDDFHSILDVITGYKMSTVVLDAYLSSRLDCYNNEINAGIRSAYKLRPITSTKFRFLSVHFLPVFRKDERPMTLQANLSFSPRPLPDEDCVLIAPMFSCNHFYLAVFNCYTKSVYVYDSSWQFMPKQLRMDQVVKVLISIFPNDTFRWNIYFELDCAQQIDDFSCGCYVIYFTENHLKSKSHRNKRKLNKAELVQLRTDIVIDLLSTTKTGSQLLEAITE